MGYDTGMAVKGFEDQDPNNPNCCHDLSIFYGVVELETAELKRLRAALKKQCLTHQEAADNLDIGLSYLRERLYGRRPMPSDIYDYLKRNAA